MSICISGVEMPKEHPLYITLRPDGSVHVWDSYGESYGTQAIPVPPHGRLIDANKLTYLMGMDEHFSPLEAMYLMELIADAPTIIPASKEGE